MIRTFCDSCGRNMKPNENWLNGGVLRGRVRTTTSSGHHVDVTIHGASIEGKTPTQHICVGCVIDAVVASDTRSKEAVAS